jgi:hypothetical protein
MSCRWALIGLSMIGFLSLAPDRAAFADIGNRPLQLRLAAQPLPVAQGNALAGLRTSNLNTPAGNRHAARFNQAEASLSQRALQSIVDPPEQDFDEIAKTSGQGTAQFRFERQKPVYRDLQRGYKDMCARVSNKIWDDPRGRRIKFDIAGKPGVALVIPLH